MALATVMVMDIMDKRKKLNNSLIYFNSVGRCLVLVFIMGYLPVAMGKVFDATLAPYFTASQIYSDNLSYGGQSVGLQQNKPQGGFVTELTPAINIVRKGPHSNFNLNYRLQFLNYEGIDISPQVFNQLQMTSKTEIVKNSFFIDSSSTISQANLSSLGRFSPDNIGQSSSVGYTTYRTLRISPYWQVHYNGYVDGEVRVAYYNFGSSNSNNSVTSGQAAIGTLDSNSYQQSVNLRNGKRLSTFGWRLSLNNQEQHNQGATSQLFDNSTIRFRAFNGEVSYRLGVYDLNAFVQSGYYDNSYPSNISTHNGAYVTPGLSWTPSPKFQLAVGYGYNAYFTNLTWRPSQRTSFQFSYRNSQVGGSNTGGAYGFGGALTGAGVSTGFDQSTSSASGGNLGSTIGGTTFNSIFQHRTRTTSWTANYLTTTGTIQQYLTNQSTFTTPTDLNGNPIGDATANARNNSLNNLNNDVIVSKRAQASLSWFLSKSNLSLSAYKNNISYVSNTSRPQDIYGVVASWNWRFSQRMNASVQGTWQNSQYSNDAGFIGNNGKTVFMTANITISRQLSSFVTTYIQYTYYHSNYDNMTNTNLNTNVGMYDSNRVTASVNIRF